MLVGAVETKVRPAVIIASETYLAERPDVLVGILTTKPPRPLTASDCALTDWQAAGLRAGSYFRAYVLTLHRSELTVIGQLSEADWTKRAGMRPIRRLGLVGVLSPKVLAGKSVDLGSLHLIP